MGHIQFRFDVEKLVQALAYFSRTGITDLDKLKAMKLLFLADKEHLLRHGRPITGDRYWCMPYGPVPSASLNILRDFIDPEPDITPLAYDLLITYFEVDRTTKHHRLVAIKDPDLDVFSDSEVTVLDIVAREYGHRRATELSDLTHQDPIWAIPAAARKHAFTSIEIPWELFFQTAGETAMLRYAQSQQEDRDFESALVGEASG